MIVREAGSDRRIIHEYPMISLAFDSSESYLSFASSPPPLTCLSSQVVSFCVLNADNSGFVPLIDHVDDRHMTAVQVACTTGYWELVELLLSLGAGGRVLANIDTSAY